jgi:hypothetical protein
MHIEATAAVALQRLFQDQELLADLSIVIMPGGASVRVETRVLGSRRL